MIKIYKLQLIDLISPVSLAVINTLEIQLNEIQKEMQKVNSIPVVNDSCERAVQLASLFNNKGPKSEEKRQNYYLTIDSIQNRHLKTVEDYNNFYTKEKLKQANLQ